MKQPPRPDRKPEEVPALLPEEDTQPAPIPLPPDDPVPPVRKPPKPGEADVFTDLARRRLAAHRAHGSGTAASRRIPVQPAQAARPCAAPD